MTKKYKILITGAAGFLGSHLSEKLTELGHTVVGIDNMIGGYKDNIPNNIEYVIAVPHNIIGPKQIYTDPYRNVVSIFLNRMMQGKAPIVYGDGEQKRCFSYIDDCLSCMIPMLDQENLNKQIINIGPDEEFVTVNKVVEICSNVTGSNLEPIHMADRPQEVKHATCSADKARKLLNYETKVNLNQGIKQTYEYIKKRGTKDFDYRLSIEIDNDLTPKTWKNKEI